MNEFMSPSDELATQMHELYVTYVRAGFTETQALKLIAFMVTSAGRTAKEEQ